MSEATVGQNIGQSGKEGNSCGDTRKTLLTMRTDAFLIEGGNYTYAALVRHAQQLERELSATDAARKRNLARAIDLEKTNAMLADNWANAERECRALRLRLDDFLPVGQRPPEPSGAWAKLVCDVCGETFSGFHKLNRARDRCCPTCYALDTVAGMES